MRFIDLSNEAMTVISRDLLDPAKERPILARLSRVAPLLVDLESAHRDLLTHQTPPPKVAPEMAALNEKVTLLDARHDRLARGLYDLFDGLAALTDDADESDAWRVVQQELFPQGKSIINRSYIDQAGEAVRVATRLSDSSRTLLERFSVGGTPLIEYVRRWQMAGTELGEAEKQRILLSKESPETRSVREVRNAWIGAMKAILAMLDREKDLGEVERRRVLEPLETALAKAAARKRSKTTIEAKEGEAVETPKIESAG